jgi:phosphate transport system substrate-binding protein
MRNLSSVGYARLQRYGAKYLFFAGLACLSVQSVAGVNILGSDSVEPVFKQAIADFKRAQPTIAVSLDAKGTGAGMVALCKGEADIALASRKISSKEFGQCRSNSIEYYQLPVGWDAVAIFSHPSNTWLTSLTVAELTLLFEAEATEKVTSWNQVRASFPASKINLIGLDMRSGTADFFSTAIKGYPKLLRADLKAESDHARVSRLVASTPGAVGYASVTGVSTSGAKVELVAIDEGTGKGPIAPSTATILDGRYDKLSRLLYMYVSKSAYETKPDVKAFVDFSLLSMGKYVMESGALPLTSTNYETSRARLRDKKAGGAE